LTSPGLLEPPIETRSEARRAFLLVFLCTLIGAVAQIFVKKGTAQLGAHMTLGDVAHHPSLFVSFCWSVIHNAKLFIGYVMYGVNTFLMAFALKGRELSRLYPIIALTYVWVALLSLVLLAGEHMNLFRVMGIALIVSGVSILGLKR
jgi:multidrug transporter EmrE-like cation transporter